MPDTLDTSVEHRTIGDAIVTVSRDNSGWIRALIQTLVLGGGMTAYHLHTTTIVNDGKDEQRAHWHSEQLHRDSLNKVFQDSVLHLLSKHIH